MTRFRNRLVKVAVALALGAGVVTLFLRTVDDARSEPFAVRTADLTDWSLAAEASPDPGAPLIVLRAPPEMPTRLFRQLFNRVMESLNTPPASGIALILGREAGGLVPVDELLALARDAGLDTLRLEPRCFAHRRIAEPGATRQVYYLPFDNPEFDRFRQAVSLRLRGVAAERPVFDPAGLPPVLFLAASSPDFARWLPLIDPDLDCVAPIVTS